MTDENSADYVQGYVSAKLEHESRIIEIQNSLFERVGVNGYEKQDIHITVYPNFTIHKDNVSELTEFVESIPLEGREVQIHGSGVWPSIKNPRVVLLDCSIDIESEREKIEQKLQTLNTTSSREPVTPHITLFKCNDATHLKDATKKQIQLEILNNRSRWKTRIKYVDVIIDDK